MHSEDDLRAALRALEREAPEPSAVLAGLPVLQRRHTVRRRTVLAAAAVAAVGAVPLGARFLLDRDQRPAATGAPSHPWVLTFTMDLDGYQTVSVERTGRRQSLTWQGSPGGPAGNNPMVVVHDAGNLDASPARRGEPVTVRGLPGFLVREPLTDLPSGELASGVFWEYAPGAWAIAADFSGGDGQRSLRLAESVRFDQVVPIRVPYRVGRLPGGLRPDGAGWYGRIFDDLSARTSRAMLAATEPGGPWLALECFPDSDLAQLRFPGPGGPVVPAGDPVPTVLVNYGSFGLSIRSATEDGAPGFPVEELLAIARSITPTTDYRDLGAWFDAIQAIPVG